MFDFATHQYHTWRAIGVFQNSSNFLEVGWFTRETIDQKAHPYQSWKSDAVPHEIDYNNQDITPLDTTHQFTVKDPDNNDVWSFLLDGSSLGSNASVTLAKDHSFGLTESEAFCTGDSRLAHFNNLQIIAQLNGAFTNYDQLRSFAEDLPWRVCITAGVDTQYDVKQQC